MCLPGMIDDNFTSYLFTFCHVGIVDRDALSVAVEASSKTDGEKPGKLAFIH
jgi:hypothetical protein